MVALQLTATTACSYVPDTLHPLVHFLPSVSLLGTAFGIWRRDEYILSAVILKGLAGKTTIKRLYLETRDVYQSEPFIFCGPP